VRSHADALAPSPQAFGEPVPALHEIGFEKTNLSALEIPTGTKGAGALFEDFFERIDRYDEARNFPAVRGPSYMGVHLRFGTVSIRQLAAVAHQLSLQGNPGAATWLSELIWRDFYFQVLAHFPHVHANGESKSFRPEYDKIQWHHGKHADQLFEAWCEGRTGYPLVDAAMLQINQSGYMHNRLRMVVASFLCKDLGLDWRRGEAYFALHLNDFELASNNGGWQWASSSGCDAQPYFRIFNPVTQSERFDPEGKFIRRYLPQLAGLSNAVIHAPWTRLARRSWRPPASSWARTTRSPWSTMPRRARRRCSAMGWRGRRRCRSRGERGASSGQWRKKTRGLAAPCLWLIAERLRQAAAANAGSLVYARTRRSSSSSEYGLPR
jgi:deoxyribodipyrimidine photo-lyase